MVQIKFALLAFVLLPLSLFASASPFHYPRAIEGLPKETSHIAWDEETGKVIAYNSAGDNLGEFSLHKRTVEANTGTTNGKAASKGNGKRDAAVGACSTLSSDDVQKLPGWNTLVSTAKKNWGNGSYKVVTNDQDYPNLPAQACTSTNPSKVEISGQPQCNTQDSSSQGTQTGTSGIVTLTHSHAGHDIHVHDHRH